MRLTKQTGYAIRILVECARGDGALVKINEVARRVSITPQNAFKIVHLLSRAGFLACTRGPAGGCQLARTPGDIHIGEVVRAMEETIIGIPNDGPRSNRHGASDTAVNAVFDAALEAFIKVLNSHSLAELASMHPSLGRARGKPKAPTKRAANPPNIPAKRAAKARGR